MGKAKKPRRRKPKPNPTGIQSEAQFNATEAALTAAAPDLSAAELRKKVRQEFPLVGRLEHEKPEEREQACHDIAALVSDNPSLAASLARTVTTDLCKIVSTPGNHPERIAAVGALRNMSLHGHQVCDDMVRSELVGPAMTVLPQACEALAGFAAAEDTHEFRFACFMCEHLACLFSNLSEASEHAATQLIAANSVVPALLRALSAATAPISCQLSCAQALVVLTDDNQAAQAQIAGCGAAAEAYMTSTLGSSDANIQLRLLLASILFNTKGPVEALPLLQPVLCGALAAADIAAAFEQHVPSLLKTGQSAGMSDAARATGMFSVTPSAAVENWWFQVRAQILALEMLTNGASMLAEAAAGDDDEDDCDWDSMEGMSDDALQARLTAQPKSPDAAVLSSMAGYLELAVAKLAAPSAKGVELGVSRPEVKEMADAVWELAAKAANLLTNLSSSITPTEGGAIAPFFVCWGKLRAMLQPGVPPTVTGAVVASLAAVLRQANNLGVAAQLVSANALDDPVLEAVVHVATAAQFDAADRATALSMLGIAGELAADTPIAERCAQAIAQCVEAGDLVVATEALNALFDMFSDDVKNMPLFMAGEFGPKLQQLLPQWKQSIRAKASQEDPMVVENAREAGLNLKRFIQYKSSR